MNTLYGMLITHALNNSAGLLHVSDYTYIQAPQPELGYISCKVSLWCDS